MRLHASKRLAFASLDVVSTSMRCEGALVEFVLTSIRFDAQKQEHSFLEEQKF